MRKIARHLLPYWRLIAFSLIFALLLVLSLFVVHQRQNIRQEADEGTTLSLELFFHGIGQGGDNANQNSLGNANPIHPQRTINIDILDAQNQRVLTREGTVTYDQETGSYKGSISANSLSTGTYTVKIKTDQYLRALVPGIQTITEGQENILPETRLIVGDINNDNYINIHDYTILIGCYSDLTPAKDCTQTNSVMADINDDGNVNSVDYNLFLRELLNLEGEGGNTQTPTPTTVSSVTSTVTPTLTPTLTPTHTPTPVGSGTLTSSDLSRLTHLNIYFGHQSVGENLMQGVSDTYASYGVSGLNRTGSNTSGTGGFFADAYVGQNVYPLLKNSDFNAKIRGGIGNNVNVAFFKYCFVDITSSTDTSSLFNAYRTLMANLVRDYPDVVFLYVTTPLTTDDVAGNIAREQFNALMRAEYSSTGRLFDLANVESTRPDGTRVVGTSGGHTYYSLYNGYTSDGGHLNITGRDIAAEELLLIIANATR